METLLILLALLLCLIGIAGCVIPGLPGHPLNYLGMWCVQWAIHPYEINTLIAYGIVTVIVLLLDYFIPIWTAKKYGATKQGIRGSVIGMVIGFFFTPVGMILGTMLGAIIGDMVAGRTASQSTRSGFATFAGTLVSIGLKLAFAGVMTATVIYQSIKHYVGGV